MKRKNVIILSTAILSLACLIGCGGEKHETLQWPSDGLFSQVPKPNSEYGRIGLDLDDSMSATIYEITVDDWNDYVEECKNTGYTIDAIEENDSYEAYNEAGYQIDLSFRDYDENDLSFEMFVYAPKNKGAIAWPTVGLATLLPTPSGNEGEITVDSSSQFNAYICNMNMDAYNQYVADCQNAGFIVDYSNEERYYDADNENGDSLRITYEGFNTISIRLYAAEESAPSTNDGSQDETSATEENENQIETIIEDTSAPTNGIDPDFKAMMDEYEAFFDEYIAFMQNYNNSGNSLDMLGDYASMMTRYAEFAEKIDSVNTDELTNEELAYYTEVTARVTQKLLNASLE